MPIATCGPPIGERDRPDPKFFGRAVLGQSVPARPILICAALPYECEALVRMLDGPRVEVDATGRRRMRGYVRGAPVVVQETGLGLEAAGKTAALALEEVSPCCLIASGLAGALSPSASIGDAIVPDRVAREGGEVIEVDGALRAVVAPHLPEKKSRRGLLISVDEVVRTRAQKAALVERTRADAVDMESAALLEQAREAGVAALVVRAASDDTRHDLPDLEGLDLSRSADQARLVGRTLLHPAMWWALPRLARGGRLANRTLRRVFEKTLPLLTRAAGSHVDRSRG